MPAAQPALVRELEVEEGADRGLAVREQERVAELARLGRRGDGAAVVLGPAVERGRPDPGIGGFADGMRRDEAYGRGMWDIVTWHNGTLGIAWWAFIVLAVLLLVAGGSSAAKR